VTRKPAGTPPSYRLHKHTGQAVVSFPRPGGGYTDRYLGPFGTPESRAAYARWSPSGRPPAAPVGWSARFGLTIVSFRQACKRR
jgi:hypothetical protein